MVSGLIKVFLNAFLDWILIFGKFGMLVLGVKGAALATSISNIVAIIFIIIYFFNTKEINLKLTPKEVINFNWKSYSKIVSLGIPTGIETFIWHISNLIMVRYLNSLNVMAVGIYTLVYNIEIIVYRFYYGFSKSVLAFVGYKVGDKKFKEAKKIVASALKCDNCITPFYDIIEKLLEPACQQIYYYKLLKISSCRFASVITSFQST